LAFNLNGIAQSCKGQEIEYQTILYFLNSKEVSEVNIAKAGIAIQKVEESTCSMPQEIESHVPNREGRLLHP